MSESSPLLLQICANDHPPFADICRYHAAAAAELSWRPVTVMLQSRGAEPHRGFHYPEQPLARALGELIGASEPVLVLCHRYRAYRAALTSGVLHAPVVAVAHEFGLLARRQRRWQRRWDRLRGRPPVIFAGVSAPVRDELARVAGDAVLLPNGIDLARSDGLRLSRDEARERLGLPASAFVVGVIGRLHPKKNPLLAVEGFAAAVDRMPEARLVLLGDGDLAGQVEARARDLPVTLAGFVPNASRLMAALDVLLLPSGRREAFGLVALEAMAARVPVLCGPSPGPRFVIGDAGRYFAAARPDALAEALCGVHRDWAAGTLAALGQRARTRVEREFSVAAAAGRLQALALAQ